MRLPESLVSLADQGIIEKVLRPLMSGKEAQVYLVVSDGEERVAKIYKDAQHRTFKQRSEYTEGRSVRSSRDQRAIGKRTRYGKAKDEEAWRSAEVDIIYRLRDAGVRVPEPFHFIDGVLIMEMITDADGEPAPRLAEVNFTREEAQVAFDFLLREVVKMLCAGVVHGDLSDFNVLMGPDGPVIIDFPQSVDPSRNQNARKLLLRDVDNLKRFVGRFTPSLLRTPYGEEMWDAFQRNQLTPDTPLRGRYAPSTKTVDTTSLLDEIESSERDEARRREALGLAPIRPRKREVIIVPAAAPARQEGARRGDPRGGPRGNSRGNDRRGQGGGDARASRGAGGGPRGGPGGQGPRGQDGRGQDGRGQDGRGQDGRGQDGRGQDGRGQGVGARDGRGQNTRGPDLRGPDGRGQGGRDGARDGRGPNTRGPDLRSQDTRGQDTRGQDGRGQDGRGQDGRGQDARGPNGRDGRGPDGRGQGGRGPNGRDGRGPNGRGQDGRGPDPRESEARTQPPRGPNAGGPNAGGPNAGGPNAGGPNAGEDGDPNAPRRRRRRRRKSGPDGQPGEPQESRVEGRGGREDGPHADRDPRDGEPRPPRRAPEVSRDDPRSEARGPDGPRPGAEGDPPKRRRRRRRGAGAGSASSSPPSAADS